MLEHLGAYTIDADGLSHRAMAKGAPGHEPTVEDLWQVDPGHAVARSTARSLEGLVFRDPEALARLEAIVHPLVREAVDVLIRRAKQPVIVRGGHQAAGRRAAQAMRQHLGHVCAARSFRSNDLMTAAQHEPRGGTAACRRPRARRPTRSPRPDVVIRNTGIVRRSVAAG